jgi:hypothetical protein
MQSQVLGCASVAAIDLTCPGVVVRGAASAVSARRPSQTAARDWRAAAKAGPPCQPTGDQQDDLKTRTPRVSASLPRSRVKGNHPMSLQSSYDQRTSDLKQSSTQSRTPQNRKKRSGERASCRTGGGGGGKKKRLGREKAVWFTRPVLLGDLLRGHGPRPLGRPPPRLRCAGPLHHADGRLLHLVVGIRNAGGVREVSRWCRWVRATGRFRLQSCGTSHLAG